MSAALKERPIIWEPLPGPQTEFLAETARECLLGGSLGGGKMDSVIMSAVSQTGNKNHRALILRKTFPQLRDVVARAHELFLPLGARYNKQENVFVFPSGARVELGFLDAQEDMYRYMGRAFTNISFEELTSWNGDSTDNEGAPVSAAYVYMMSRLRSTDPSLRLEIRASCTPGGVGASWVKNRFGIPDDGASSEVIDKATGYRRRFIRATIADNPHLANTAYARSLESLPTAQHRALVDGRWTRSRAKSSPNGIMRVIPVGNLNCRSRGTHGSGQMTGSQRRQRYCLWRMTKRTGAFSSWMRSISAGSCPRSWLGR